MLFQKIKEKLSPNHHFQSTYLQPHNFELSEISFTIGRETDTFTKARNNCQNCEKKEIKFYCSQSHLTLTFTDEASKVTVSPFSSLKISSILFYSIPQPSKVVGAP